MIILSSIILILSSLLQSTVSNFIGYTYDNLSIFSTIYVLVALMTLIPFFENKKKYFTLLIIFSLIIDIAYTNTFIFNLFLFIICYYMTKLFHTFFPYNFVTISISNLLSIFLYHIITFIFLNLLKYDIYSFKVLLKILSHSILMTIIYSNILYLTITLIIKKFDLKEVK